eukprot:762982-Hanusia_phi.AAC.1
MGPWLRLSCFGIDFISSEKDRRGTFRKFWFDKRKSADKSARSCCKFAQGWETDAKVFINRILLNHFQHVHCPFKVSGNILLSGTLYRCHSLVKRQAEPR